MSKKSAGIVLYRFHNNLSEVLLVHPDGPFWAKKDLGAIVKTALGQSISSFSLIYIIIPGIESFYF